MLMVSFVNPQGATYVWTMDIAQLNPFHYQLMIYPQVPHCPVVQWFSSQSLFVRDGMSMTQAQIGSSVIICPLTTICLLPSNVSTLDFHMSNAAWVGRPWGPLCPPAVAPWVAHRGAEGRHASFSWVGPCRPLGEDVSCWIPDRGHPGSPWMGVLWRDPWDPLHPFGEEAPLGRTLRKGDDHLQVTSVIQQTLSGQVMHLNISAHGQCGCTHMVMCNTRIFSPMYVRAASHI